ncbi:MAG: ATP--guanido phosphotransferase [Clostridiaceae bacterium]|nr:ATP--guanido phosphotransferase [Clostridiaceae bacterium]
MSWYSQHGPDQDIVISTRVRLARNIVGFPFPHLLNEEQSEKLINMINDSVNTIDPNSFHLIRFNNISEIDKLAFTERHIISPQLLKNCSEKALIINSDEDLSIVISDEDHMRIQGICAGFEPDKCFDKTKKLAVALEGILNIAYDQEFGYLTACPTNVGTGLRISALLHVPGLYRLDQLKYLIDSIRRSGYTVRGYFGEGSSEKGQMIQISNQITLGQSDTTLIEKFKSMLQMFIEKERKARKIWYQERTIQLEDKIYRSEAILKNALLISYDETFEHLSNLRLGKSLELEDFPDYPEILTLSYLVGVGSIQKLEGEKLNGAQRDEVRAKLIKNTLINKNK